MSKPKLPTTFRDTATPELVDRVWLRLEENLEPARPDRASRNSRIGWSLAASVLTFVLGVGLGSRLTQEPRAERPVVRAEPRLEVAGVVTDHQRVAEVEQPLNPSLSQQQTRQPRSRRARPSNLRDEPTSLPQELVSDPVPVESHRVVDSTEPVSAPAPTWQRLANAGEYEAALFELSQEGGFEAVVLRGSAEQLMLLADVARATGQQQRALAALRRIISEFRAAPVAPLAAFSLGNLLERSGDARGAAQAFAVYRSLSPEGDFAEDALVRQIKTAVERGDRDVAEQLAAQYHAGFPEGRRGQEIQRWLDELAETTSELAQAMGSASDNAQPPATQDPDESPASSRGDEDASESAPESAPPAGSRD